MRSVRALELLLVLLLLLSVSACSGEDPSPYADSPYKAMAAYVAGLSPCDCLGAKPIPFSVERDFRYSSTESAFVDEAALSGKVIKIDGADQFMTYVETKPDRYTELLHDTYERKRSGMQRERYATFERETGRLLLYLAPHEVGAGEGFSSDAEIEAHAKELALPYLEGGLDGYDATVCKWERTNYTYYEVVFTYRIENAAVSEILVGFSDSAKLRRLELYGYRANAAELTLVAGKDATAREKIAERVAPHIESGQYTEYEMQTGFLYYDTDGRPYLLYRVELISEMVNDRVDFLVYIE